LDQLLQRLKKGDMEIASLPDPVPGKKEVLVRTYFSAISTGTEGKTVSDARKGYVAKAKARKEEVAKVVNAARSFGVAETYKMVMNKLESLQPLGYSLSGEVLKVGEGVSDLKPGDRVACGGSTASHAELVIVPENLCAKLPSEVPADQAAFTTIAAIALQGIRRADLSLGERCAVIGLGLLGQLTIRLLRAAGIRSYGVDLKNDLLKLALRSGAEGAALRNSEYLEEEVKAFSQGHGVDAVIITAATPSTDPVELAGRICRHHGKVVVVGAVATGFSRKNYYRKELELRMSTSYGPGRYDANYEEKGLDYPIGQVRWTENRNMRAIVDLLGSRALDVSDLISHRFPFRRAKEAFDLVVDDSQDKMGVILEYDPEKEFGRNTEEASGTEIATSDSVSFIGAGSFACNFLLPNLREKIRFSGVATRRPHTAEDAKRKFGFDRAYADAKALLNRDRAGAVFIATRHDSHAALALKALNQGKRVFLEKPLCLTLEEWVQLKEASRKADIMVGFNRRFAPAVLGVKKKIPAGLPKVIQYRINAGKLPHEHWVHDPEIGGGRVLGEACHFVDLCLFFAGCEATFVSALPLAEEPQLNDSFVANLQFADGSIASITYFSNGNPSQGKEWIQVSGGGFSAVIDDFGKVVAYGKKVKKEKWPKPDKGHAHEMSRVAESLVSGNPFPISTEEVFHSTLVTFALLRSLKRNGERVEIAEFEREWNSPKAS
jgi:polar amino acid transport system substrate-binding protein